MKTKFETREEWLMAAVEQLRPLFKQAGTPLPEAMRFTVSFPWQGARGNIIGQHFPVSVSKDGTHEMLVHPKLDDPYAVVGVIAHELVHAALPPASKHGRDFAKLGKAVGLTGKPKHMGNGPEFDKTVTDPMLKILGAYPHAGFDWTNRGGMKKQTTRLLKCECAACGYIARVSAKWIDEVGPPICPTDEMPMEAV
jgi:hypothetical protein